MFEPIGTSLPFEVQIFYQERGDNHAHAIVHPAISQKLAHPGINHWVTGAAGFIGSHTSHRLLARGDEVVGLVTSGGFGYRIGKSIALAYVRTDLAVEGTELEVEILGERRRAVVSREPIYDPENARLRA